MNGEGKVTEVHTFDSWKESIKAANESKKLVVINFSSRSCRYSRLFAPSYEYMADQFRNVIFFMIEVDEFGVVTGEFEVDTTPTSVFMKEGQIIDRVIGANQQALHETLLKHGGEVA
ncbi:unnamed protein product [Microthlaspi erraticum]|uniref:Thioredoxin domain-containing protein n=1 Tax=Microthlaspi erraticum TaxID=1685480 RepID=A0A6D2I8J1_9BRAS|nr:unnamed protein product [Microthlaspi erraticum]